MDSDAPASVGQIHDIFAEYEETFSLARGRRKTAGGSLRDCPHSDTAAGSIPRPVGCRVPQAATDKGVTDMKQLVHAAGGATGCNNLSEEDTENKSASHSRQEGNGQEETEVVRSQCISTLASGSHSESARAFSKASPSPPPVVTNDAALSDPGALAQEARTRKRVRSPTRLTVLPDDGATRKRPRRAKNETWKVREAREAREEFETKRSQTSLNIRRKKQTLFVGPLYVRGELDHRVADVDNAYLREDGSIQCLITLEPSLISIQNLVGEGLRRRCEIS